MGTVLITHKRLLQVNLISHSVLPGLALAVALGVDPSIGGVISGLFGALLVESLTNKRNDNYDAVMNTILAGSLGLGVLLVPLFGIRIDLESVLFGDLLTADYGDLLRTLFSFLEEYPSLYHPSPLRIKFIEPGISLCTPPSFSQLLQMVIGSSENF